MSEEQIFKILIFKLPTDFGKHRQVSIEDIY